MTLGERRVRVKFNVGGSSTVDVFKQKSAELIDLVNDLSATRELDKDDTSEFFRLRALAMTAYEEAAGWAVKAATI
jgi:hypothetical protein